VQVMKPQKKGMGEIKAHSAPTEARRLNLKPPGAPSLASSPSPSADPPLFQLPGSPSAPTTIRLKEEKILSRSAPSRLRRLHQEAENRSETASPVTGGENSEKTTPVGSPTIYSLLQHRGQQPRFSGVSLQSILGSQKNKVRRPMESSTSSHQKVAFGSPMSTLPEQGRGLKPEKTISPQSGSLSDLQFEMDKDLDDRRKDTVENLDFLDF